MVGRKASSPKPSKKPAGARKATTASDGLPPFTDPEKHLIGCVKRGERCAFDENQPVEQRTVRALVIEKLMREQTLPGSQEPLKLPAKGLEIWDARIQGVLDLVYCASSAALTLVRCEFPEKIVLRDARLRALRLTSCYLHGIAGNRLRVEGRFSLQKSTNRGEICLADATVEGQLSFKGARLENADKHGAASGNALSLDGAKIGGDVFLDEGFSAKGEVRMLGATVEGDLVLTGALENADKDGAASRRALSFDGSKIGGDVLLGEEFSAKGEVRMPGATVEGDLVLTGATLENADKDGRVVGPSLLLQKATVNGACIFRRLKNHSLGDVHLTAAVLAEIVDDGSLWPEPGNGHVALDGLVYDRFVASPVDWRTRKAWLMRQFPQHLGKDFKPHSWVQCAKVLREMGHDHDARMLLFHMHEEWRRASKLREHFRKHLSKPLRQHLNDRILFSKSFWRPIWDWTWSQILRWTAGHGYQPARAIGWMIGTILVGWAIFSWAHWNERMTPAKERFFLDSVAFQAYQVERLLPKGYPEFSPFIYSLDVFLPIVSFGQEDHWRPANVNEPLSWRWWNPWTWNWLRGYNRFHIILGWVFTSIAVLAFTGVIKRD